MAKIMWYAMNNLSPKLSLHTNEVDITVIPIRFPVFAVLSLDKGLFSFYLLKLAEGL